MKIRYIQTLNIIKNVKISWRFIWNLYPKNVHYLIVIVKMKLKVLIWFIYPNHKSQSIDSYMKVFHRFKGIRERSLCHLTFSAKPSVWGQYVVVCCFVSVEFSANPSDCSRYAVSCFVSIEFSIKPAGIHRYSAGILWVYLTLSTKPSV